MLPVQLGIPGGPELLVALMVFVVPIAIIVFLLARTGDGGDEREELQRRVGRLEARVDRLEDDAEESE